MTRAPFAFALLLAWGCGSSAAEVPERHSAHSEDLTAFKDRAQPTLARSCAFPSCHPNPGHGLDLYAVGRLRAIENPSHADEQHHPLTPEELRSNLDSVLLFVDPEQPAESELLVRALPRSEGGRGHGGGVLFPDREDPGYRALLSWVEDEVTP